MFSITPRIELLCNGLVIPVRVLVGGGVPVVVGGGVPVVEGGGVPVVVGGGVPVVLGSGTKTGPLPGVVGFGFTIGEVGSIGKETAPAML